MNIREFSAVFARTLKRRGVKAFLDGSAIRIKRGRGRNDCPLSFVAHDRMVRGIAPCSISKSGEVLSMPYDRARNIADAADNHGTSYTRQLLLKAAGLA